MDDSVNTLQSSTTAQQQQQQQRDVIESNLMISITNHHLPPPPPPPPFTDQQNHINNLDSIFWSKTLLPSSSSSSQPITEITTRNPKKRSRASRRAPTTVLSTNTDNFRSMVQEFTGIPPPPFASIPSSSSSSSSSPLFPTTSFDLFGRPNYSTMMMRSNINNFDNLPQQPSMISSLLDSCYLPNTMQINPITFLPSNSLDQPSFLTHHKTTENLVFSNGFDGIQQTDQIEDLVTFQQSPQSPSDE